MWSQDLNNLAAAPLQAEGELTNRVTRTGRHESALGI